MPKLARAQVVDDEDAKGRLGGRRPGARGRTRHEDAGAGGRGDEDDAEVAHRRFGASCSSRAATITRRRRPAHRSGGPRRRHAHTERTARYRFVVGTGSDPDDWFGDPSRCARRDGDTAVRARRHTRSLNEADSQPARRRRAGTIDRRLVAAGTGLFALFMLGLALGGVFSGGGAPKADASTSSPATTTAGPRRHRRPPRSASTLKPGDARVGPNAPSRASVSSGKADTAATKRVARFPALGRPRRTDRHRAGDAARASAKAHYAGPQRHRHNRELEAEQVHDRSLGLVLDSPGPDLPWWLERPRDRAPRLLRPGCVSCGAMDDEMLERLRRRDRDPLVGDPNAGVRAEASALPASASASRARSARRSSASGSPKPAPTTPGRTTCARYRRLLEGLDDVRTLLAPLREAAGVDPDPVARRSSSGLRASADSVRRERVRAPLTRADRALRLQSATRSVPEAARVGCWSGWATESSSPAGRTCCGQMRVNSGYRTRRRSSRIGSSRSYSRRSSRLRRHRRCSAPTLYPQLLGVSHPVLERVFELSELLVRGSASTTWPLVA